MDTVSKPLKSATQEKSTDKPKEHFLLQVFPNWAAHTPPSILQREHNKFENNVDRK